VNTQWKGISIRDKVEGTREIPATPYVLALLAALPRRNQWVFSSPTSASGCLTEWLEVPVGVVAQIHGHKRQAVHRLHHAQHDLARNHAFFFDMPNLRTSPHCLLRLL
jgi:hypothetical protein